jgi:hypothetical protein
MTTHRLALALFLATGCSTAPDAVAVTQSALAHAECDNPNPALYEKDARLFGASMETWAERWWAWAWGQPFAGNPNLDPTADCDVNQQGPLFFLPHLLTGASTVARTCTVPRGKPIAVTVASVFNDYPCPDPTFQPAPGQSLFDFLIGPAKEGQDHVASIVATLDGVPLADVMSYRVASDDIFHFTGDLSMQAIDNCVTGSRQDGVVDSFFIVLKPLRRGTHDLTVTTTSIFGTVFGPRTITLDVAGDH